MKLYDDGNTGIALGNHFVETHAGNLHVYEDRTQAGDIVFITTDNFKKYIPINWIKNWCVKNYPTHSNTINTITEELLKNTETWKMIEDWEKENETSETSN